jgi:hypothetical protein
MKQGSSKRAKQDAAGKPPGGLGARGIVSHQVGLKGNELGGKYGNLTTATTCRAEGQQGDPAAGASAHRVA